MDAVRAPLITRHSIDINNPSLKMASNQSCVVGCHRETVRDRDKFNFVRGYDLTNEETDREKVYEKANG